MIGAASSIRVNAKWPTSSLGVSPPGSFDGKGRLSTVMRAALTARTDT
jgi:hypothetical protein